MVRKSERAAAARAAVRGSWSSRRSSLAALLGLLASIWLTARLLRPLGVVSAAVRRFGEGDLKARAGASAARTRSPQLAAEFNSMADQLERYRQSSLGELLAGAAGRPGGHRRAARPGLAAGRAGRPAGGEQPPPASLLGVDPDRPGRGPRARRSRRAGGGRSPARARAGRQGRLRPAGVRGGGAAAVGPTASASSCRGPRPSTARRARSPAWPSCCRTSPGCFASTS